MQVKHLLLIAVIALTSSCSLFGGKKKNEVDTVDENLSENQLYQQAQQDLGTGTYSEASKKLKALESRYPFGRYAEQAELDLIYSYYKLNEMDNAKAATDRFIRLHPEHPNVDYAYYMKGMASFEQDQSFFARWLPLDMSRRDPGAARDSFNEFSQLVSRYPNSRYAPDAKARMVYLRDLLSQYEIHVAYFYLQRHAYVAAANRGRYVVENYQGTPAVADGLAVMVEAYTRLQLDDLAATSLEALKMNYPDHSTLASGKFVPVVKETQDRGWLARNTLKLIERDDPLPPGQTRAAEDLQKRYREALDSIPDDIRAGSDTPATPKRTLKNRLSFGLLK